MDGLRHRMGVQNERAVGKVLQSLATKGLESRVPIQAPDNGRPILDSRGRQVFAARGHRTMYRVPRLKAVRSGRPIDPVRANFARSSLRR